MKLSIIFKYMWNLYNIGPKKFDAEIFIWFFVFSDAQLSLHDRVALEFCFSSVIAKSALWYNH